jgi:hypothetical protein
MLSTVPEAESEDADCAGVVFNANVGVPETEMFSLNVTVIMTTSSA